MNIFFVALICIAVWLSFLYLLIKWLKVEQVKYDAAPKRKLKRYRNLNKRII